LREGRKTAPRLAGAEDILQENKTKKSVRGGRKRQHGNFHFERREKSGEGGGKRGHRLLGTNGQGEQNKERF